jgi:hypothetical protein
VLVPITLVPVEVFGGDCDCHLEHNCRGASNGCVGWGYGLCDAVSSWSDCNRASGRIYRVEDLAGGREPGDTITVYVPAEALGWFQTRHGDNPDALAEQRCHTCGQTRPVLVEPSYE